MNRCISCGLDYSGRSQCPQCGCPFIVNPPPPQKRTCVLCGGTFHGGVVNVCAGCALLGANPSLGNITLPGAAPAVPKDGDIALSEPRPAYKPNPFMAKLRDW